MINPQYKFELSAGETTRQAFPVYRDDLSLDFEKESGQEFFRAKLSGNLTFQNADFLFVKEKPFDTQFGLSILISYDAGVTWSQYWTGTFWKTDCDFDEDSGAVKVKPTVSDRYNAVLSGLEKEYNLIDLSPEITPVKADKRPMIQVYVPGESVVGCFLSGMWWEQEAEPVSDTAELVNEYHFAKNKTIREIAVTQSGAPALPSAFAGDAYEGAGQYVNGGFRLDFQRRQDGEDTVTVWDVVRVSDGALLWHSEVTAPEPSSSVTLQPEPGSGATGVVELDITEVSVYSRYVLDVAEISGVATYPIPAEDIVANNRNYSRVIGYYAPETIYASARLSDTPTQWGIYQPGQYYEPPYLYWSPELFPIARNSWGRVSLWFSFFAFDWIEEEAGRNPFTIRHAYPLSSVISVLLNKVAPGLTHEASTEYSQFLYGTNLLGVSQTLLITPKSNIVSAGYDQPAQKAMIKLKDVLDMLRDCFRCYWWVDEENRFRVEHIRYFENGGSYNSAAGVGIDLTEMTVSRNGKPWAFGRNQYTFDKPEMAARYQFGWMDDVTQLFEGYPIDIVSKYVNPDNIEQINVSQFTSDIDYILLNPGDVSKDGFVLLSARDNAGALELPYYNYNNHYLQNGFVSFTFLQGYYAYDMPAPGYEINGVQMLAYGTKRMKNQSIRFPALRDPNLFQLVKTNLGPGMINKLSLNLSSRSANATLKHDTE